MESLFLARCHTHAAIASDWVECGGAAHCGSSVSPLNENPPAIKLKIGPRSNPNTNFSRESADQRMARSFIQPKFLPVRFYFRTTLVSVFFKLKTVSNSQKVGRDRIFVMTGLSLLGCPSSGGLYFLLIV
jgi:hypothetical protein